MKKVNIHTVLVCGAGTMGCGIAQTAATAGYDVYLFDVHQTALSKASTSLARQLEKMVSKGKIAQEESASILGRIRFIQDLSTCDPDLIIEAIIEDLSVKTELFLQLAASCSPIAIFASNTSSLSLTAMADQLPMELRTQLIGLHFFNPAPLMKLVEIVHTPYSSVDTRNAVEEFARHCGKTAVHCKDAPGFIVNRVARPFYLETLLLCEETGSSPSQLDQLLRNAGFRMGPFELMDLVGNDVNYAVSVSVFEQLGKPERMKPSELQAAKVAAGLLGKKTGEGFYQYNTDHNQP